MWIAHRVLWKTIVYFSSQERHFFIRICDIGPVPSGKPSESRLGHVTNSSPNAVKMVRQSYWCPSTELDSKSLLSLTQFPFTYTTSIVSGRYFYYLRFDSSHASAMVDTVVIISIFCVSRSKRTRIRSPNEGTAIESGLQELIINRWFNAEKSLLL